MAITIKNIQKFIPDKTQLYLQNAEIITDEKIVIEKNVRRCCHSMATNSAKILYQKYLVIRIDLMK